LPCLCVNGVELGPWAFRPALGPMECSWAGREKVIGEWRNTDRSREQRRSCPTDTPGAIGDGRSSPELRRSRIPVTKIKSKGMGRKREVRATHSGDSPAEMGSSAWPAMAAMATVPGAPWAARRRKEKGKAKLGEGRGGCGDAHRRANRAGVAWSRRSTRELCPVPKQGRWKSERGGTTTASWVAWRAWDGDGKQLGRLL